MLIMLKAKSISCYRNGKLLFSDINFKVQHGSNLLIHGVNGSGKSTLLRMIAGFIPINIGSLYFNDKEITNNSDSLAEKMFYLSHLTGFKANMTCQDNIAFWENVLNFRRRTEHTFGENQVAKQRISECSEGQKQRLSLSRLSQSEKKIWLLDEPTNSLDHIARQYLIEIINDHCSKGGISIISTHQEIELQTSQSITLSAPSASVRQSKKSTDPFLKGFC